MVNAQYDRIIILLTCKIRLYLSKFVWYSKHDKLLIVKQRYEIGPEWLVSPALQLKSWQPLSHVLKQSKDNIYDNSILYTKNLPYIFGDELAKRTCIDISTKECCLPEGPKFIELLRH